MRGLCQFVRRPRKAPGLIIADYTIPGDLNGIDVVKTLRGMYRATISAIIYTGVSSDGIKAAVDALPNVRLLIKPAPMKKVAAIIEELGGPGA